MSINITEDLLEAFLNTTSQEWSAFKDHVSSFAEAVDWKEPLVVGVLSFHVVVLLLVLLTRKKSNVQAIIFFSVVGIVFCAKYINDYLISNWQLYTKNRYFEETGFFISIMMSAPMLLIAFIILVNFLLESMGILVELKTKQLRQKIRDDKLKAEKEAKKDK